MNDCAVSATEAREQSNQGGVVLTAILLELLTVAQSKVEVDRQATQACLSRATALLEASLERNVGPKARSAFRGGLPRWQAKRLTTFIEENLEQPIRSPDLIALTGLSTGHFFRTFKETFGQAPFAYIAGLRIERAQRMMLTTNHSLCQIALDCGMCDQSHLTRLFRQLVGMTPGEWRRIHACGSLESTSTNTHVA
jgi:AraC-like DNA-binding protein